ncbi:MAG TPA: 1-deoxy-D-xylulose-5-phosphate reductoisomerase [Chloroflexota bacterium]|nr:1-deoxy-D-xylulose-5-phosphate reductoisomerase [Chloroflexota bacterium]HZU07766.1 1-deoxy-D-xylulose-5-phosphate reductoisomerase [Chloroflexota bacterium]
MRKRIAVLGSTGSVGRQALEVIAAHGHRFEVVALAAGHLSASFEAQLRQWQPRLAAVTAVPPGVPDLRPTRLLYGEEALTRLAAECEADLVLVAVPGRTSLCPTLAALASGKTVALASKEALVMGGHLVMATARAHGVAVLPVDSEHNAIWQCLRGEGPPDARGDEVAALVLTASGGAFRDLPLEALRYVTPADALRHPTWSMGPKITVDSATLMNKGMEVMEASWLFGVPLDRIRVILHRESIVHSLVEFIDGSLKAQLAVPDMRLPIQYALSYPERWPCPVPRLDLVQLGTLTFSEVERERFRCLYLALEAAQRGGTYPSVLVGADDEAVRLFLEGALRFDRIPDVVEEVLAQHQPVAAPSLEAVLEADRWARRVCRELVAQAIA